MFKHIFYPNPNPNPNIHSSIPTCKQPASQLGIYTFIAFIPLVGKRYGNMPTATTTTAITTTSTNYLHWIDCDFFKLFVPAVKEWVNLLIYVWVWQFMYPLERCICWYNCSVFLVLFKHGKYIGSIWFGTY